ncbi:MAG: hypothetical protein M3547_09205, partial [Acidobacteriota bacterium]|nr:hypothetical protein [Acidobacteriota bacterium]
MEGVCDTTIDKELEKLGQAYSLAIEDQRVAYKPPIPKLVKMHANARQGFVEFATFNALLEHVPDPDIRDFLAWFCYIGMRPKEIQSLTWEAFDRETWSLRLAAKDAKTGRGRVFMLTGVWREV